MESKWSGSSADAFFNGETFDHNRRLLKAEEKYNTHDTDCYYTIAIDVGRTGCDSVATVVKIIPQLEGEPINALVNIYVYNDMHFEDQAAAFKKLYYKFKARRLVIDANGLGIGLIDYMVKSQTDPATGEALPPFGVYGATFDNWEAEYKKYSTGDCERDAMYLIKANPVINTEAHSILQTSLVSNKLWLLIEERTAKAKLLSTAKGKKMTPEERAMYLQPYVLTSELRDEMLNLREDREGINIILSQANKTIKKDKFSSLEYNLYYNKKVERSRKKRKRFSAKEWAKLFN